MDTDQTSTARRTAQRGTAALGRLWARLGLPPEVPEVVSNRGSLMVRMPRARVVARVSTHTGAQRRDPGWWLANEVAVGRLADAAGAGVVAPSVDPDAGPHEVDGLWVSLWTDLGDGRGDRPAPEDTARALARWHRALQGTGQDLPVLTVAHGVVSEPLDHALRHGFLDAAEHAALHGEHEEVLAGLEAAGQGWEEVVLHGDAHRGNLLRAPAGGWLWGDLEEACRGPVVWDLAVLGSTPTPEVGVRALAAYCAVVGRPVPTAEELAPWLRLRRLEGEAWGIGCAVTFPERYAAPARRFVDEVVAGLG